MKQYEYGVRYMNGDVQVGEIEDINRNYAEVREFVDWWNRDPGRLVRAEVVVRTVEVSPWTLHHHEKIRVLRGRLAVTDAVPDSKWYEV